MRKVRVFFPLLPAPCADNSLPPFSDDIVRLQLLPCGVPRVPGHEIVGDIVAVATSEQVFKIGDRVGAGWHGGQCGCCRYCLSGDIVCCDHAEVNGKFCYDYIVLSLA